jgi:hypothetical protein
MDRVQKRNRRIVVSFSEAEFAIFEKHYRETTAGSYCEYVRAILMVKPVLFKTHNVSIDQFLDSMIDLKKDLKSILHFSAGKSGGMSHESGSDPAEADPPEVRLKKNVETILSKVVKLYQSWLQSSI